MATSEDPWRALSEYADVVSRSTSVGALVERTLVTALKVLSASSASASQFEVERGRVKILHNTGDLAAWEHPWPDDTYYMLSEYAQLMTLIGGPSRSWRGSVDDPETAGPDRELLSRVNKQHAASFRVSLADNAWGDIYVTRGRGDKPFSEDDLLVGEVLAGLMSAGLSRLELLADLANLAYTDPLTGLGNRRAADEWLERRLSLQDEFVPIAAVLCDINGLKGINDSLGHTAGDDLLRLVAGYLTTAVEDLDDVLVARLGGDEFLLLMSDVERHDIVAVEKRLADLDLPHNTGLAVGAASTRHRPHSNESTKTAARSLLRLADAAQYRHKQTRRVSHEMLLIAPLQAQLPAEAAHVVDDGLRALDEAPGQSMLFRLQAVCNAVAHTYDVASWWVSCTTKNGKLLDVLSCVVRPDARGDLSGIEFTSGTEFDVSDFPATRQALEGGSYYASLTEGDESERAFLARMGYVATLAAGEPAVDETSWLVELFADTQTSSSLFAAEPSLRALVHIAVQGAAG